VNNLLNEIGKSGENLESKILQNRCFTYEIIQSKIIFFNECSNLSDGDLLKKYCVLFISKKLVDIDAEITKLNNQKNAELYISEIDYSFYKKQLSLDMESQIKSYEEKRLLDFESQIQFYKSRLLMSLACIVLIEFLLCFYYQTVYKAEYSTTPSSLKKSIEVFKLSC